MIEEGTYIVPSESSIWQYRMNQGRVGRSRSRQGLFEYCCKGNLETFIEGCIKSLALESIRPTSDRISCVSRSHHVGLDIRENDPSSHFAYLAGLKTIQHRLPTCSLLRLDPIPSYLASNDGFLCSGDHLQNYRAFSWAFP